MSLHFASLLGSLVVDFWDQLSPLLLITFCPIFMQYGVKIFVLTSFKETCYIEILPHVEKSKRGNEIDCCSLVDMIHYLILLIVTIS